LHDYNKGNPFPLSGRELDAVRALAWCSLPDGMSHLFNDRWREYVGQTAAESNGSTWNLCIHECDLGGFLAKSVAIMNSGRAGEIESRLRRHDGEYRWFLFRLESLHDDHEGISAWFGTTTDIDRLKRTEASLLDQQIALGRVADAIPHAIVVQDPNGVSLYANRVTLEYTGLSIEDVALPDFRERIFHPADMERVRDERQTALRRGEPFEIEQRAKRHDGQYRWFLIRYNPFRDERGRLVRWYATGTDIHDRKRRGDRTINENVALREEIDASSMFEEIVGSAPALRNVLSQIPKVAPTDSTVLVLGETGTGKELLARAIHRQSKRAKNAFIRVNCAAIPSQLIMSELFGHEKGAFTGALQRRIGRFEAAEGGTILLDEVGELPLETQVVLLRVLQEREFERVGSSHLIASDVRVIASTNRDLPAAVASGAFRQDLFYRLNVFPIRLPPLRERREDIPLLARYLTGRYANRAGKSVPRIAPNTLALLAAYDWPGNIRELQNVIERAVILCEDETLSIDEAWVTGRQSRSVTVASELATILDVQQKELISAALAECKGRVAGKAGAAAKLGLPRQTLEARIRALGINKHQFKS
jgi:formate hydrogenlyase transcriptional activator